MLDAQVPERRWEIALGVAVREGQGRGEIADRSSGASVGALKREAAKGEQADLDSIHLRSAGDYFTNGTDGHQTYAVTANVTDAEFDTVLDQARIEGNVSRANVVRKIKEANGTAPANEPTRQHKKRDDLQKRGVATSPQDTMRGGLTRRDDLVRDWESQGCRARGASDG